METNPGAIKVGNKHDDWPQRNKSEPPDHDGQQRDNALSRLHQCLSLPFFDVAMLVFQKAGRQQKHL